ncbi:ankyrin repeat protein [Megavirus baoshan]|uniref:Ankyrin repeat protein n=1 Tax=Megavirus baoshan TaxID=2496520 RepID=A0A3S8UYL0_9VIRU|nr:ankyrin repeat protein [Megavirus baoshan]AZL89916.1 ankyrin repeat protein [Megavirus baoshan]
MFVHIFPSDYDWSDYTIIGNTYHVSDDYEYPIVIDIKHIDKLYNKGSQLFIIDIPIDHPDFFMDKENIYYQPNTFIVKEKYSLYEESTYTKFNLNIKDNHHIMNHASMDGNIDFLQKCLDNNFNLSYSESAIDWACDCGQKKTLEWWFTSGLPLLYTNLAMDVASENGHIDILDMWLESGLPLKYTHESMDLVTFDSDNKILVLDWWLASGLDLKYSSDALQHAVIYNEIEVLNWWVKSGLILNYGVDILIYAIEYGSTDVLDWWLKSGLDFNYNEEGIDNLSLISESKNKTIEMLEWWLKSGLEIKYTEKFIDLSSNYGDIEVLDWWKKSGLTWKYSSDALDRLIIDSFEYGECDESNNIKLIEWWISSDLEIKYTDMFIDNISINGRIDILKLLHEQNFIFKYSNKAMDETNCINTLDWWKNSGYNLKYTDESINRALLRGNINVLNWWLSSELKLFYPQQIEMKKYPKISVDWCKSSGLSFDFI